MGITIPVVYNLGKYANDSWLLKNKFDKRWMPLLNIREYSFENKKCSQTYHFAAGKHFAGIKFRSKILLPLKINMAAGYIDKAAIHNQTAAIYDSAALSRWTRERAIWKA